jgi:hypothetical protein
VSLVDQLARAAARERARDVEERILSGENEVSYPHPNGHSTVVLRVPGWRERPLLRARVELARWRRRRDPGFRANCD